jgi:hypothetical protein
MTWQRVCLAIVFALSSVAWSHGAAARTDDIDPANPKIDRSESVPTNTTGPKVVVDVNLTTQSMHVLFPDGTDETWLISSGRPGYDTPDGRYKPQWVDPDHVSKQYQDAPMPYAVFFDLKGHAFHGSDQKVFGRAMSHGCVRLQTSNAKRLFDAVRVSSAEITITGRAPAGGGKTWARRRAPANYATDPGAPPGYEYRRAATGYPQYPERPASPPQQQFFWGTWGR